jgi:prephenate dehydrogenase
LAELYSDALEVAEKAARKFAATSLSDENRITADLLNAIRDAAESTSSAIDDLAEQANTVSALWVAMACRSADAGS